MLDYRKFRFRVPRQFPVSSRRSQESMFSIKGVDRDLWKWLKARAALEDKSTGAFINALIERYRQEAGWPRARLAEPAYRRNPHPPLTIRGINRELWEWLREHAKVEDTLMGELINRMIERYRAEVRPGEVLRTSTYTVDPQHITTVRGVDREVWKHLKDRGELEDRTVGEILNELIERYRREVVWP